MKICVIIYYVNVRFFYGGCGEERSITNMKD